jgi:microcompartment protein CcmK/EutM
VRIARVIGNVVATAKDPSYEGTSLLLVQPVNDKLEPYGAPIVASDSQKRRGLGEIVYFVQSGDAVHTGPTGGVVASDAAIMGIANRVYSAEPRT